MNIRFPRFCLVPRYAIWVAITLIFGRPSLHTAPVPEDTVSPHFDAVAKHLDLGGTLFAYIDIDGDLDGLASRLSDLMRSQGAPPELADLDLIKILRTLGISQISAVGLSSYQRGGRFHNKAFLHLPGGREGLFSTFGGDPQPFLAKSIAPRDTDLIIEQDVDFKSAIQAIRNVLDNMGGKELTGEMDAAMRQPVIGPITIGELVKRSPSKITIIGRLDRDARLALPDGPEIPETDLLIAFDGAGWLFQKFKAAVPPDALAQLHIDGDGYEALTIPEPVPAPFDIYRPLLYVADGENRLYLATRKEFLDECLASEGAFDASEDFKLATAGLPVEGNSLTYVSPDITDEIIHLIKETDQSMGASELAIVQTFGGDLMTELDYGIAQVSVNLPDGILWTSNSISSHKSSLVTAPLVPVAIAASFAVPVFTKVTGRAQEVRNMNSAKQLLLAAAIYAVDNGGGFPKTLDVVFGEYIDAEADLGWFDPEREKFEPWLYFGNGLDNTSPATMMMLASPRSVDGKRIVGFVDGSVQTVSENRFESLKEKLDAHLTKPGR